MFEQFLIEEPDQDMIETIEQMYGTIPQPPDND